MGSWSTTSALNTGRSCRGAGSYLSMLTFGGNSDTPSDLTERWNGVTWSTEASMGGGTRYYHAGCGASADAAMSFGGNVSGARSAICEIWNGSSWATTSGIIEASQQLSGCGDTGGALECGGNTSGGDSNKTGLWNGSTWATTSTMTTTHKQHGCCGDESGALAIGGRAAGVTTDNTRKWNGSTWANTGTLTEIRDFTAASGTTSSALNFTGRSDSTSLGTADYFNGTSWATTAGMTRARYDGADTDQSGSYAMAAGAAGTDYVDWYLPGGNWIDGICMDKNGSVITGVVCDIDVYNNADHSSRLGSAQSNSGTGTWMVYLEGVAQGTKVLCLFSYEGAYGGDTDIAGGEFITTPTTTTTTTTTT